ncbi:DinB family protein [Sinomonas sp. G460-2]|uniref:DinB family protein n=1 Tax=Sinomonas sp. G460-2 TaxID=3393464 RepID=UPI0039EF675D
MTEILIDDHGRPEPPYAGEEVATLLGFLDYHRATLEWKCRGLGDEQLRVTLPPSSMTLGGMLKHLAFVEDAWCSEVLAGQQMSEPWAGVDWEADPDWDWHSATNDDGASLRALWAGRVERSKEIVDELLAEGAQAALATTHANGEGREAVSLRWVLVHLIEEYARHNGHADLLRESIDGQIGE